jgi:hypothetical protein
MSPTAGAPDLSDHELQQLLGLLQGADSVELKLTVPDADRRSTVVALGMDPMDAFLRQVFFFDTPDLALDGAGIVTRARRTQGKPDDSVVKLRPVDPGDLPEAVRGSKLFGLRGRGRCFLKAPASRYPPEKVTQVG